MNTLHRLRDCIIGVPHLIHRRKLDAIVAAIGGRLDLDARFLGEIKAQDDEELADVSERIVEDTGQSAVVPILGTLVARKSWLDAESGLMSYGDIHNAIAAAAASRDVDSIILDIASPGGEVEGAFALAEYIAEVNATEKPVFAYINEHGFSAAYLLASGAQRIYMPKTGSVGSIGVVAMHVDQSEKNERDGYKVTYIHAGERKVDGNPHEPLSDAAREAMQTDVDELYGMFVETVATNRGLEASDVQATQAATYMGRSALQAGLADGIVSPSEAVAQIRSEVSDMARSSAAQAAREQPRPAAAAAKPDVLATNGITMADIFGETETETETETEIETEIEARPPAAIGTLGDAGAALAALGLVPRAEAEAPAAAADDERETETPAEEAAPSAADDGEFTLERVVQMAVKAQVIAALAGARADAAEIARIGLMAGCPDSIPTLLSECGSVEAARTRAQELACLEADGPTAFYNITTPAGADDEAAMLANASASAQRVNERRGNA